MTVATRIAVLVSVSASLGLSGCMGMNKMFMSDEQEAQYCSAYRQQLGYTQNADQRAQVISAMRQMGCPNTPSQ